MKAPAIITGYLVCIILLTTAKCEGQYFSTYDPNKEAFTREVKLIDEFIERFNDDPSTSLRKEYASNKQYTITRARLLVSLFDLENTSFTDKDTSLKNFFREVMSREHPVYLSFTDTDWYAAAQSVFLYKGRLVEMPLILHIMNHGHEWSKWMIAGIGNRMDSKGPMPEVAQGKGVAPSYISTSSYATNFVELHYILTGGMVPANFFDERVIASRRGQDFIKSVTTEELKFLYVKNITFHFFQVKGWMFTVEQFRRKSFNSGWLISEIHQASDAQKAAERTKLFFE